MNQQFDQLHSKALNNIRLLEPTSLIGYAIAALNESHAGAEKDLSTYRPWDILLVIQWAIQEIDSAAFCRPVATRNDLHKILNVIFEIEEAVSVASPLTIDNFMLFMRRLAFQQFPIQGGMDPAPYARQLIMFGSLPENHSLRVDFMKEAGVSPREFCLLSFGFLALLTQPNVPRLINAAEFLKIESPDEPGSVFRFFRFIARTLPELHDWLSTDAVKQMPVTEQRILPSPLLEAPLLADGSHEFLMYHPALLMRSVETMIYRTLKRSSPRFGDEFGKIFEGYLDRCLDYACVPYLTEKALQKILPGEGKCVDFLIVEDDCNILIDAKGVEMPARGKVAENTEYLLRAIKSSVNGIRQGLETHKRMRQRPFAAIPSFGRGPTCLLVVTVDELFLGPNQNFEKLFGASLRPRLEEDYGRPLSIPFENIFFLTVGDLEKLCAMVRRRMTTFTAALQHAQQPGVPLKQQKLTFGQHLVSLGWRGQKLPIIMRAIGEMAGECEHRANRLPAAQQYV